VVAAAIGKYASATTATTPVQRGHWCGRNDGKDASNRDNATGNNQPSQQMDKRADKRIGLEDAMRRDWAADDTTRGGGMTTRGAHPAVASPPFCWRLLPYDRVGCWRGGGGGRLRAAVSGVAALSDSVSTTGMVDRRTTEARRSFRPFVTGRTVTKGLAGDSGGRRQEGGRGEHNNQPKEM